MPELAPGLHHETIVRPDGDLRYTISVPEGYARGIRPPLIVLLHYAGEVTPFYGAGMVSTLGRPAFTALRPILVAPDSLGGDWTTEQNEAAVVWLTRSVIATYGVDPARVVLTGYSMGGIGTWYLAGRHQDLFTAAVPVASAPVGDAVFRIPLYVIHSYDDEVLPIGPVAEYVDQLTARGVHIAWRPLRGPTHYNVAAYIAALREASTWLAAQWAGGTAR
jgi:predicted peptidase